MMSTTRVAPSTHPDELVLALLAVGDNKDLEARVREILGPLEPELDGWLTERSATSPKLPTKAEAETLIRGARGGWWEEQQAVHQRYLDSLTPAELAANRRYAAELAANQDATSAFIAAVRTARRTAPRTSPRPRSAGRPASRVKGSSRRSAARSGSSGDDPDPEPEDDLEAVPGPPAGRLCCACRAVITHSPRARYCDRPGCRRSRSTKRQAASRARKAKAKKTPKRCAGCGCFLSANKGDAPGLCIKASLCWPCQGFGDNGDDTRVSGWSNPTLKIVLDRFGKWPGRLNSGAGLAMAA